MRRCTESMYAAASAAMPAATRCTSSAMRVRAGAPAAAQMAQMMRRCGCGGHGLFAHRDRGKYKRRHCGVNSACARRRLPGITSSFCCRPYSSRFEMASARNAASLLEMLRLVGSHDGTWVVGCVTPLRVCECVAESIDLCVFVFCLGDPCSLILSGGVEQGLASR